MKCALKAIAAFFVAVLLVGSASYAEQMPAGSYMQSCRNVRVAGGTLLAVCRQADGSWDTSALAEVGTCVGDIGNMNGALYCNRGPAFGSGRVEERREGLREQERRLRCEGIIDPIARERCFHGF
jgi:hypothetical protein